MDSCHFLSSINEGSCSQRLSFFGVPTSTCWPCYVSDKQTLEFPVPPGTSPFSPYSVVFRAVSILCFKNVKACKNDLEKESITHGPVTATLLLSTSDFHRFFCVLIFILSVYCVWLCLRGNKRIGLCSNKLVTTRQGSFPVPRM